jgi:hypothetical protein
MQQRPSRSCGCPSFCFISCFVGVQKHQFLFSPKWDNLLLGVVGPSVPSRSGHEAAAMQQRPSHSGPPVAALPQRPFRSVPSAAVFSSGPSAAALPQRPTHIGLEAAALPQRPSRSAFADFGNPPPRIRRPIPSRSGPSAAALPQRPSNVAMLLVCLHSQDGLSCVVCTNLDSAVRIEITFPRFVVSLPPWHRLVLVHAFKTVRLPHFIVLSEKEPLYF